MKVIQLGQQKENKKDEDSLRDLGDKIKQTNIDIIKVADGEEEEKGAENLFEDILAGNFLNLEQEKSSRVKESKDFQLI